MLQCLSNGVLWEADIEIEGPSCCVSRWIEASYLQGEILECDCRGCSRRSQWWPIGFAVKDAKETSHSHQSSVEIGKSGRSCHKVSSSLFWSYWELGGCRNCGFVSFYKTSARQLLVTYPWGAFGKPEDVANAAVFFCRLSTVDTLLNEEGGGLW